MKRYVIPVLSMLFVTATLLLSGCDLLEEPFPDTAEEPIGTGEIQCPAPALSDEDEALAEIAAEALWAKYDLPDRECFKVDVSRHVSNGTASVRFTLYVGGYRTWEEYSVYFSADGEITNVSGGSCNYRQYLKGATPAAIAAAEQSLNEQLADYGEHSGYYLSIDDDGYLCLNCEVIAEKPFGDHEHKFFTERICPAP